MDCKHIIAKGKFKGKQCTHNAHYDGYCRMHKKTVIPDHVAKEVGTAVQKAPEQKKYRFSAFRWTVNSNTNAAKMEVQEIKEFKRLIGFIFDKKNVVEYLEDRTNKADSNANIDELETEYHFEVAPTTHSLHAHGVIKLKHHGNYVLMLDVIRGIVNGAIGKKAHVNVQATGDMDKAWEQYMTKNEAAKNQDQALNN